MITLILVGLVNYAIGLVTGAYLAQAEQPKLEKIKPRGIHFKRKSRK